MMSFLRFIILASLTVGTTAFADCRPETWFHVIGGNVSKAGLTADLEAIKEAGFGGITFFLVQPACI